jgi:hypothetical protein
VDAPFWNQGTFCALFAARPHAVVELFLEFAARRESYPSPHPLAGFRFGFSVQREGWQAVADEAQLTTLNVWIGQQEDTGDTVFLMTPHAEPPQEWHKEYELERIMLTSFLVNNLQGQAQEPNYISSDAAKGIRLLWPSDLGG